MVRVLDITRDVANSLNINFNLLLIRSGLAILFIILGIILGKLVGIGLRKIFDKINLEKAIRGSFVELIIVVVKFIIYILFIILAINQLGIPASTDFVTDILITVPAFAISLFLIGLGFAIATYLKEIIKNSEIKGWRLISQIVFYFVLYVFGVYALKTALVSFDTETTNTLIIVLTAIISTAVAFMLVKNNHHTKEKH